MAKKFNCEPLSPSEQSRFQRRLEEFTRFIERQGYSKGTADTYHRHCKRFVEFAIKRGVTFRQLDETVAEKLKKTVLGPHKGSHHTYGVYCIDRFISFLIEVGDAPARPRKIDKSKRGVLMRDYESYLREQRGLAETTIYVCVRYAEQFLTYKFGTHLGDPKRLKAEDITEYVLHRRMSAKVTKDKSIATHLRAFFRFLYWAGHTDRNLAEHVPSVRQNKPTRIPRYLPPDEVNRLIDAARLSPKTGRRDYAILLLMARLGLRAPEVVAIVLEDIDWRRGEILIRGKGRLHDRMPLPIEAGEALVDYLKNERRGSSRSLFVSTRAPFEGFADAQIVNFILEKAYDATGLRPPQSYVGSHILRHSLATDLLRNGASLEEISDVLRHRSPATTTIYAQYDIDALRSLSKPWPAEGGVR